MQSAKEIMTRCGPFHWKHAGYKIAVALMLMGFLPACDRAGNPTPPLRSVKARVEGKRTPEAFKARHAIFLYHSRPDDRHPYDQPVTEKRVVVLT